MSRPTTIRQKVALLKQRNALQPMTDVPSLQSSRAGGGGGGDTPVTTTTINSSGMVGGSDRTTTTVVPPTVHIPAAASQQRNNGNGSMRMSGTINHHNQGGGAGGRIGTFSRRPVPGLLPSLPNSIKRSTIKSIMRLRPDDLADEDDDDDVMVDLDFTTQSNALRPLGGSSSTLLRDTVSSSRIGRGGGIDTGIPIVQPILQGTLRRSNSRRALTAGIGTHRSYNFRVTTEEDEDRPKMDYGDATATLSSPSNNASPYGITTNGTDDWNTSTRGSSSNNVNNNNNNSNNDQGDSATDPNNTTTPLSTATPNARRPVTAGLARRMLQRPKSSPSRYNIPRNYPLIRERFSDTAQISATKLGSGTFGDVYLGVSEKTGMMMAVKRILVKSAPRRHDDYNNNDGPTDNNNRPGASTPRRYQKQGEALVLAQVVDECMRDIVGEIILMKKLDHPNIVRYYHAEIAGSQWEKQRQHRKKYLHTFSRWQKRQQALVRSMQLEAEGEGGDITDDKWEKKHEEALAADPPPEVPQDVLSSLSPPPSQNDRHLLIFMEYMSGGSLGSMLKTMYGDSDDEDSETNDDESNSEYTRSNSNSQRSKSNKRKAIVNAKGNNNKPVFRNGKPLPLDEVVPYQMGGINENLIRVYFLQAFKGLAYLHANNVVHRDIKADNLLVAADGSIRISDFGTSREFRNVSGSLGSSLKSNDVDVANTGAQMLMTVVGTPWFMSPEVVQGTGHGFPADIWSMGATILHLATGRVPLDDFPNPMSAIFRVGMEPTRPSKCIPLDASEHLQDLMRICLAPDPEDRWTAEKLIKHPFFVEEDHRSMGSSASESLSSYEHEDPNETEYV